jgi:phosphoglycolate phosphatase
VRNIIFDLDGTLVDSVPGIQWSAEAAMRNCGISRACPDLTPLIGPPVRSILGTAAGTDSCVDLDRLEKAFRTSYDVDGWRRTVCQPGVRPMLDQLQSAGGTLWIVTNKPAHATQLILRELALAGYFQEIVSRDSVTPSYASKGAMVTDLLDRRALSRAESILIGDTLEDCHAASAAGIACAIVPHGYGKGMDGVLPEGCRRIAGWDELVYRCTGSTVFTKDSPQLSALMGKRENSDRL